MNTARARAAHAALAFVALVTLVPNRAPAEEPKVDPLRAEEASRRFKSGVAAYKDRDFTAALADFKRAYELLPNWSVLFNLGQTARELHDYAAAVTAFERYLAEGGARVPAARRKEAQLALDELHSKVAHLRVTSTVDGAEVSIDDIVVGVAPLPAPLTVNPGRRRVTASLSGYSPAQRAIDIASQEQATVALELVKLTSATPVVVLRPTDSAPNPSSTPLWVSVGATAAVGVAAGVTGALALSAHSSLTSALGAYPGNPAAISSDQSRTRAFAAATDALGALTLAGAAATVAVFVVLPKLRPRATVGVTPHGVTVATSF